MYTDDLFCERRNRLIHSKWRIYQPKPLEVRMPQNKSKLHASSFGRRHPGVAAQVIDDGSA
jgi:hypothetical protein